MISKALRFLHGQALQYLKFKSDQIQDDFLMLSHFNGRDGDPVIEKMGMMLVRIEEDKTSQKAGHYRPVSDMELEKVHRPLKLNLDVMFTANFGDGNYIEALKFLSLIVEFFHKKDVFTVANSPEMDPKLNKLSVELKSMSYQEQSFVWSSIGGKMLPYVIYKVKLIVYEG